MLPSLSPTSGPVSVELIHPPSGVGTRRYSPHPTRFSAFAPARWHAVLRHFRASPPTLGRHGSCGLELNFPVVWSGGNNRVTDELECQSFRDSPDDSAFSQPAKKRQFKRSLEEAIRQPCGLAARVKTTTRTGPAASARGKYRILVRFARERGEMGSRTVLVVVLALAPIPLALPAPPAHAPEITLPRSAYPSALNKRFPDPTIGIRG